MKLLMHTCCAPCSIYCIETLRKEGIEPTIYWYNPNIHPYMEYKARRDTLKEYTKSIDVQAIFEEDYGLDEFCKNVICDLQNRCVNYCYRVRMEQTAKYAKEHGYNAITTTLLISPYQKHEDLKEICEEVARKYNLEFIYRDFRIGFREGQAKARDLGLYMQKYCGCVFSEESSNSEHILKDIKHAIIQNKITERKIRLNREVPNLDLKPYKSENQEGTKFIYNVEKDAYKEYREKIWKVWNEESQKKVFEKFIKKYAKTIQIIILEGKYVGFYNGKNIDDNVYELINICIIPEYQNKGIGTAVLKEILFEHKGQNIKLQVFKINERAIKLYEKLGFKKSNETETHYIMKKIS